MEQTKKDSHSEVVTMRQLLECGVHFGHQTKRWNPKMKKYIFTSRNGIHVIDLQQSIKLIKNVYELVKNVAKKKGTILFVGTKKQAQDSIREEALKCGMPYVHHRWLGGTLTNIMTIRQSINKYKKYIQMDEDGTLEKLSNKEASRLKKEQNRLSHYLDGIKDMTQLPSILFVIDTKKEQLAIKEATKLNIPVIGIVDTNADPSEVQYPIPANDDAIRAIRLLCSIISNAICEGTSQQVSQENEAAITNALEEKATNSEETSLTSKTTESTDKKKVKETSKPKENAAAEEAPKKTRAKKSDAKQKADTKKVTTKKSEEKEVVKAKA